MWSAPYLLECGCADLPVPRVAEANLAGSVRSYRAGPLRRPDTLLWLNVLSGTRRPNQGGKPAGCADNEGAHSFRHFTCNS